MPAASMASTRPMLKGSSGPIMARPIFFSLAKVDQFVYVGIADRNVGAVLGRARIARGDVQLIQFFGLLELPCNGVFTPTTTNEQNVHAIPHNL